jgi:hypothetical protein
VFEQNVEGGAFNKLETTSAFSPNSDLFNQINLSQPLVGATFSLNAKETEKI